MKILIKRAYEAADAKDGYRVLVDRLWPRGLSKEKAALDWWDKEIAPTPQLRMWFGHSPERWQEFSAAYTNELKNNTVALAEFKEKTKGQKVVTLVYAAKDEQHTHALVLQSYLNQHL